ncbi:MAG: molybdopterin-guanine dinucleotide biosynthesis protein B [Gammaproteobacteria bacterium RIFCSPLOWO2_02_FULL_61_13]|nr:MAG: molybdopterin-guanine dinucleotide biosynthesis protein B [Gammaproteobacteria bacterium RIFCSPLOWO2_02_FULL_61_13]
MLFEIPVVGFAAYSGTGKTTLLVRLLRLFTIQGLRVGIVKHAHHTFEIDHPGKDSYELRQAGASQVLVGSRRRWALMAETPKPPQDALAFYLDHLDRSLLDLVLVEGFKPESIPKIELHRPSLGKPLLYPEDNDIIAVATDSPLVEVPPIPVFDLNDPAVVADFIIDRFKPTRQTDG